MRDGQLEWWSAALAGRQAIVPRAVVCHELMLMTAASACTLALHSSVLCVQYRSCDRQVAAEGQLLTWLHQSLVRIQGGKFTASEGADVKAYARLYDTMPQSSCLSGIAATCLAARVEATSDLIRKHASANQSTGTKATLAIAFEITH